MFSIAALFTKVWFKPVAIIVGILALVGALWWTIHNWEENIYKRGYDAARVEVAAEQAAKLKELTNAVNLLSKESNKRADALDAQQKAFAASTSAILIQIKNKPLVVANAKGDCKLTTEASKAWNDLQKSLQD